jgi:hypothetical protein
LSSELGPKTLGDILNETFSLYGKGLWTFVAIVVVPQIIMFVLSAVIVIPLVFLGGMGDIPDFSSFVFDYTEFKLAVNIGLFIVLVLVLSAIYIIINALMQGALIHAVSEQSVRQTSNFGQSYSAAWQRIGNLIGASLLVGLAVALMAITIIGIPVAIYFGVRWSFILQTILIEGSGITESLSRSSDLVEGDWWRVFGIMLVVVLIVCAISFALGFIPIIGSIIAAVVTTPVMAAAQTLLCYDLRYRKGGYTTETLARELGV